MTVVRISKYCQSVQAFGLAPRSIMGSPELAAHDARSSPAVDPFGDTTPRSSEKNQAI